MAGINNDMFYCRVEEMAEKLVQIMGKDVKLLSFFYVVTGEKKDFLENDCKLVKLTLKIFESRYNFESNLDFDIVVPFDARRKATLA